jgi:hypothetical protein
VSDPSPTVTTDSGQACQQRPREAAVVRGRGDRSVHRQPARGRNAQAERRLSEAASTTVSADSRPGPRPTQGRGVCPCPRRPQCPPTANRGLDRHRDTGVGRHRGVYLVHRQPAGASTATGERRLSTALATTVSTDSRPRVGTPKVSGGCPRPRRPRCPHTAGRDRDRPKGAAVVRGDGDHVVRRSPRWGRCGEGWGGRGTQGARVGCAPALAPCRALQFLIGRLSTVYAGEAPYSWRGGKAPALAMAPERALIGWAGRGAQGWAFANTSQIRRNARSILGAAAAAGGTPALGRGTDGIRAGVWRGSVGGQGIYGLCGARRDWRWVWLSGDCRVAVG